MNAADSASWQAALAACLLEPGRAVPAGLRTPAGVDRARRLAVHRNNVVAGLAAALASSFPVVRRLVGTAFFDAMAAEYVRAQPPRSPMLAAYGDGFADWIEHFAPAAPVPYLADVARLERARVQAFHAADARALDAAEIAARLAEPAALPRARLVVHPSCRALASAHAVVSIWRAHQVADDAAIGPLDADEAQSALVMRDPADEVLVIALTPAAGGFCRALAAGAALGAAAEAAAAGDAGFELAATLGLLIRHGAIVGWASAEASS